MKKFYLSRQNDVFCTVIPFTMDGVPMVMLTDKTVAMMKEHNELIDEKTTNLPVLTWDDNTEYILIPTGLDGMSVLCVLYNMTEKV